METRIQHVFLKARALLLGVALLPATVYASDETGATIDSDLFDLGLYAGIVNIADFNGEAIAGLSATFQASEDFFLQYNIGQADASPSAYEQSQGLLFDGSDRQFQHYDLLVGYRVFQSEFFGAEGQARLASLYLVSGVGETRFGGEDNFTTTVGVGYELALTRRVMLRIDYRTYLYASNLISDQSQSVQSSQLAAGLSYRF